MMQSVNKMTKLTLFLSIGLIVSYMETPFGILLGIPGIKIGFANIVTLLLFELYCFKEATLVTILRIIMVSMFRGFSVSFMYAIFGGMLSLVVMSILFKLFRKHLTLISISMIGAFFHNLGQVIAIGFIFSNYKLSLYWFPLIGYAGIIAGLITGFIAVLILKQKRYLV